MGLSLPEAVRRRGHRDRERGKKRARPPRAQSRCKTLRGARWGGGPENRRQLLPRAAAARPARGCIPPGWPRPLPYLRRALLGSRRLQLPPRPEEEEEEGGEPEHPQQRQRQPPRRPPHHPREQGGKVRLRRGMKGGGSLPGAGLSWERGLACPPRSRRCESRAVHALQGRGGGRGGGEGGAGRRGAGAARRG